MKKYCLACDLKDDDDLIRLYDEYHQHVWPEIRESLRQSGILEMEIYRTGNRLFMIINVEPDFSFEKKAEMDLTNPVVQKWETLMSTFQQKIPWAKPGVKWLLMDRVFSYKV
ncbi:MAG TPA: L-rhamnose mutarotase [Puia sp.]|jgi:L-rhamnose mutarotase|nr:L-rhamnose mutarotase [Puia sp.]